MPTEKELFLLQRGRAWLEAASSEYMVQWYVLVFGVLALGFVVSEIAWFLRTKRTEFSKAKATGTLTWRMRIGMGYLILCAASEICHRIVLIAQAHV
jgi:hypothetical protein